MSKNNGISKEMRDNIIAILQSGEMLPPGYIYDLFPSAKKECELIYGGKTRAEEILAQTMAMPLQRTRLFGNNGNGWHNKLVFGDNLQAMKSLLDMKHRGELCNADGTPGIRLVYIDPPFATKQELSGGDGGRAYQDKLAAVEFLEFLRRRLIFIRELLSDDGSVYVHLDWRMNSYVRILMDEIFGKENFRNEIIWAYKTGGSSKQDFSKKHDSLLFYSKGTHWNFNIQKEKSYTKSKSRKAGVVNYGGGTAEFYEDEYGVYNWINMRDVWDLPYIGSTDIERIGYPTQKPELLLNRIIETSSNKGDIVADFFCGSGTTCAVAEKIGRRWVGVDCGKLSIYTTQRRMLNLHQNIGNTGDKLLHKPFALYNAGLYDINLLHEMNREGWRKFALLLFECRDEPHKIGGIEMDGYRKGKSVMVFNHHKHKDALITEETINEIHTRIKRKSGDRVYIIAPVMSFWFLQDYIDCDDVRYYALRIPYSFIYDLHRRNFSALLQPATAETVNDIVDAVGFDFIHCPKVKYSAGIKKRAGKSVESAFIKITTFKKSEEAYTREPLPKRDNLETFSMLMLDYNYSEKKVLSKKGGFELDQVFFADELINESWTAWFPKDRIGEQVMAIFVDIYGNEARELIPAAKFNMKNRAPNKAIASKKGNRK